jgi:hypothetical protein
LSTTNLNEAIFRIVGDTWHLGAPQPMKERIAVDAPPPDDEDALYDFLVGVRMLYDHVPEANRCEYEISLDETGWLAAVAWNFFLAVDDDLNLAVDIVEKMSTYLLGHRALGMTAREALGQLNLAIDDDLANHERRLLDGPCEFISLYADPEEGEERA